jgi:hypothetical protein
MVPVDLDMFTINGSTFNDLININRLVLAGNMSDRSLTMIDVPVPATWQKDCYLTATELFTITGNLFYCFSCMAAGKGPYLL